MTKFEIEQKIKDLESEKVELTETFMKKLGEAMGIFHLISRKDGDCIHVGRHTHPAPWNQIQCASYFCTMDSTISGRPMIDNEIHGLKIDLLRLNQNN